MNQSPTEKGISIMTNTPTKTYIVGVIERAIAYYKVEAEDARTAADNWSEGDFWDRDDEALDTEGPCNVREDRPDGSCLTIPASEWDDAPAAAGCTASEIPTGPDSRIPHTPEPWLLDGFIIVNPNASLRKGRHDAIGGAIAEVRGWGNATPEEQRANARRIVAAVNACWGIATEALERHVPRKMLAALQMASNYMADDLDEDDETEMRIFRAIGTAIAEAKADGFAHEPSLTGKQLTSNGMFHTPGFFRALQNDYRIKGKTRRRAVKILSDGYGLSLQEADGLLSGAIKTVIDEPAGTITYTIVNDR
jgi:hypothetical protein